MALPPPPLPPPPPPPLPGPGRVLRDALERAGAALGDDGGVRELLRRRREAFSSSLTWLLFHRPAPPLIQDGPQCGLVALWMAATLLTPTHGVGLEEVVGAARARGFTAQGEMFSAATMATLAQELFPVDAELISGGLERPNNRSRILRHLVQGYPLLVPYDEDSNHEPCHRRGHKAHWAVLTGVVLGGRSVVPSAACRRDPEIPNLFHAPPGEVWEGWGEDQGQGDLGGQGEDLGGQRRGSGQGDLGGQGEDLGGQRRGLGQGDLGGQGEDLGGQRRGSGQGDLGGQGEDLGGQRRGSGQGDLGGQGQDLGQGEDFRGGPAGSAGGAEAVLVLAQQGKSPRPQLWAWGALSRSNAQLRELSPRREADGLYYVLPEGGLAEGLGGRAVLLYPRG